MSALVFIMSGVVTCSSADTAAQVSTRRASLAARPGQAHVIGASTHLRPAGPSVPAGQVSRFVRSALRTGSALHSSEAALGAPAELSGTMHRHGTEYEHDVSAAHVSDDCDSCHTCDERHSCRCWRCCVRSTCDMVPHAWYRYSDSHGYYYFRPYHYTHLDLHREFITSNGGDPRSPYADGLFENIYREMEGR